MSRTCPRTCLLTCNLNGVAMSGGSPNKQKPRDAQEPLQNGSGTEANRRGKSILGPGTDLRGKWRWAAAAHRWRSPDLPCPWHQCHINFYPHNGSKTEAERKQNGSCHVYGTRLPSNTISVTCTFTRITEAKRKHNGSKTEANQKSAPATTH